MGNFNSKIGDDDNNNQTTSEASDQDPSQTGIVDLPAELIEKIAFEDYTPGQNGALKDAAALSQSYRLFNNRINPRLQAIKLVQHVVYGEQVQAEAMLKANPNLLLVRVAVEDYSGRIIKATAYQAALGAMDVDMVKMIAPYFNDIGSGNGETVRINQYKQQFPNGKPVLEPYNFDQLVAVISNSSDGEVEAQLQHEEADTPIYHAIKQFRADVAPCSLITSGYHFNHKTLISAFAVYNKQFDNWNGNQRDVFWRQVIGYIQRYLPACDAQAFARGLYDIVENNKPLVRSLEFKYDKGVHIFPSRVAAGLGFDFAVSSGDVRRALCAVARCERSGAVVGFLYLQKFYTAQKRHISTHPEQLPVNRERKMTS